MSKSRLGKGLAALLPEAPAARPGAGVEVDVAAIRPNPLQPRRTFPEEALRELAESIRLHGLLQPVVVSRAPEGGYHLIAGERRFRAARMLGLERIPAVVREAAGDTDLLALALIENVQRQDLTPIEEARAYHHLRAELGLSQEEVAARVGKERSTIANALRLLQLPLAIQEAVDAGDLSAGHARCLAGVEDAGRQRELAERCVRDRWSVRELEERARPPARRPAPRRAADPETEAAADRLSGSLGARVAIHRRRRGGEIRIAFTTEQELIRLFRRMLESR
jgi:ParB family transcriptional regulator, chromosome partitioning protein